jgi:ketosteroid isomerase-like protein
MASGNADRLDSILAQLFAGHPLSAEHLADDAEWVNPHDAIEPGTRHGAAGFNEAIRSVFSAWDEVRLEVERLIENGDDVVALGTLHGRVHGPGMEIDSPHGQIWTFRDGRVIRMQWFNTHDETLDAAGMGE